VHFVKMIYDQGHAEQFVEAAKTSNALVTIHAESVQFVKEYLVSNRLRGAVRASVVDPCPGDPFECFED
jgi:hypothetical protein